MKMEDDLNFFFLNENYDFKTMEDDLKKMKMEDNLN
jgi:hypothetical protein